MAVGPKELVEKLLKEEKELADRLDKEIEKELWARYSNESSINICISAYPNIRVRAELDSRYVSKGWGGN